MSSLTNPGILCHYRHIISLPAYYVIAGKLCLEVLDPSTAFLHLWFTNALQWHVWKIMIRSPIDEGGLQKLLSWNLHLKRVLKKCPKSSSNAPLKSVLLWHDIMQQKSLISRWVNRWVSWSFIVSDWRLLSQLRALRACFSGLFLKKLIASWTDMKISRRTLESVLQAGSANLQTNKLRLYPSHGQQWSLGSVWKQFPFFGQTLLSLQKPYSLILISDAEAGSLEWHAESALQIVQNIDVEWCVGILL